MMTARHSLLVLTALVVVALAACTGAPTTADPVATPRTAAPTPLNPPEPGVSKVVLLGDSVASGLALPLDAALEASGIKFHSLTSTGGGNVVGPSSAERWETLPDRLDALQPSTVIYPISTFDWGTEEEQQAAYERLAATVADVGATLVFVTSPPIVPDDFYEPHTAELARAPEVARRVAEASADQAVLLDASAVWGDTFRRTRDGIPDRSSDGIHTCPQGAARHTSWLLEELARLNPGFTPPAPEEWANAGWSGDEVYVGC